MHVAKNRHQITLMDPPPVTSSVINPAVHTVMKHTHMGSHMWKCTFVCASFPIIALCGLMPALRIILKPNVSFNLDEFPTASASFFFDARVGKALCGDLDAWHQTSSHDSSSWMNLIKGVFFATVSLSLWFSMFEFFLQVRGWTFIPVNLIKRWAMILFPPKTTEQ